MLVRYCAVVLNLLDCGKLMYCSSAEFVGLWQVDVLHVKFIPSIDAMACGFCFNDQHLLHYTSAPVGVINNDFSYVVLVVTCIHMCLRRHIGKRYQ